MAGEAWNHKLERFGIERLCLLNYHRTDAAAAANRLDAVNEAGAGVIKEMKAAAINSTTSWSFSRSSTIFYQDIASSSNKP